MKKMRLFLLIFFVFTTLTTVFAQCWVDVKGKGRMKGISLKADSAGNLTLTLAGGKAASKIRKGSYTKLNIPKPSKKIRGVEGLYKKKKYAKAISYSNKFFNEYKFLNWGGAFALIKLKTLLKQKKYSDVLSAVSSTYRYAGTYKTEIKQCQIEALIALNKMDQVAKELPFLGKSDKTSVAAFSFNTRGKILAGNGNKRDAVLQYLKTLLLISPKDKSCKNLRFDAKKQVVRLLKEMGDNRAASFSKMN